MLKRLFQLFAGDTEDTDTEDAIGEMGGEFSLKQFYRKLNIPREDRSLIEDAMAKGLGEYYHDLYGYDKYGKEPDFLIGERMREPQIFGYAAVRILHHEDISDQTKRAVAAYTVAITRPLADFGVPHGLLAAISYLVAGGHLRGEPLATAIRHLAGTQDVFVGLTTEDTLALTDGLLADEELAPEERLDLLYFLLIRCQYAFALGKAMFEQALETPALTSELKKTLCTWLIHGCEDIRQEGFRQLLSDEPRPFLSLTGASFGLVPDYLKRRAIFGLAQIEDDPAAVVRRYLGQGERYDAVPFDEAVGDIIEAYHEEMPPAEVRDMVELGVQAGKFQIRLRFYQLGLELYGPDFIRPALDDRSSKVRKWAEKALRE